jgi:O-antigen ligase
MLIFGKGTKLPPAVTLGSNAPGKGLGLGLSAGGAVLACVLLFGIPARRRGWRAILPVLLLLVAASGFTACIATPKMITAGQYTFTVTGTDSSDTTITTKATVEVRVL